MDQQQPPPQQQPTQHEPPPQQPAQHEPPPGQGWAPPPSQGSGNWGQTGYAPPARPTGVTMASIFLIVMGVLWTLGGAACSVGGGAIGGMDFAELPGLAGAVGGMLLVLGIIALVIGILQIAAGAGAISGKNWGRVTGIIVAAVAAVLFILGGVSSLGEDAGSGIITLAIGVLYALSAWALAQAGPYFAYRR